MSKILIVDHSPDDRQAAGRLLSGPGDPPDHLALTVLYADSKMQALALLRTEQPDAVLTDLQMPDLDGLALVQEIRVKYPLMPIIVMTARENEDLAVQALRLGAASYVPKSDLAGDLRETVGSVLEAANSRRAHHRLMCSLTCSESQFVLDNDPALIPPLVGHLRETLAEMTDLDDNALLRVSIALREAVLNAMEHGNLEMDSALRENDGAAYHRLCDERRGQSPYRDRRVTVRVRFKPGEAEYVIRDDGPGFNPAHLPDALDPAHLERTSGRGLLLIRAFMTEVRHNERGNEITLVLRT
jgi:CheY-like chemotaxis protein/anti-sigma regulatory factor (Ser/Thr protein kinase)